MERQDYIVTVESYFAALDAGRARVGEDGLPALHDLRAVVEGLPAGMDAGDRRPPRPEVLHGREVALAEGRVEGLVHEQYRRALAHRRSLFCPRPKGPNGQPSRFRRRIVRKPHLAIGAAAVFP